MLWPFKNNSRLTVSIRVDDDHKFLCIFTNAFALLGQKSALLPTLNNTTTFAAFNCSATSLLIFLPDRLNTIFVNHVCNDVSIEDRSARLLFSAMHLNWIIKLTTFVLCN